MTLLSVVLPTRNRAGLVGRAAASVLAQDVGALELVVVDDASSDDTPDALDRLASQDKRVRIVRTDAPVGPCVARNRGLEAAEGDLVSFCDDDDMWLPGAGPIVVDALTADARLTGVSSWHVVMHADSGGAAVFRGPLEYDARHLLWQNVVAMPFAVIRRSVLSFDVGFDPRLPTGEDWDLWLRCAREGPFRSLPHVSYLYTQHGGTRVTRTSAAQIEGRRNFLTKHGEAMSPGCRLYHEAVLAGYESGRSGMLRRVASRDGASMRDVAYVSTVLVASWCASRIGTRRADPGLQARRMVSWIDHDPGRNRHRS